MLELADVYLRRGASQVLEGVSMSVGRGEIVALLGANGAGKTSTLMAISGILRPHRGHLRYTVDEHRVDLARTPPDRIVAAGIAHCPEGRQLFGGLTVRENLRIGAFLRRDDRIAADEAHLLRLFPVLGERIDGRAGQLSGGEQMMLAIARALMSRPRLLLLDEPSLGLAPQMVERIFDTLQAIRRQGTTVLLVEQNAAMALEVADRGYVLENGRITLEGSRDALTADPRVRDAYLGLAVEAAS